MGNNVHTGPSHYPYSRIFYPTNTLEYRMITIILLFAMKVDATHPATKMYDSGNSTVSYRAGTCVRNAPDCGQTGRSCCYWESGCCASPMCSDANARCEVVGGVPPGVCVMKSEASGTDSSSSSSPSADPSG